VLTAALCEALKAAIQDGLPLTERPYLTLATALGCTEQQIMRQIQFWLDSGYIKRMGLVVKHRSLGYDANAMVVWNIPDAQLEDIARRISQTDCVSLCYERPRRLPDWPYNLFCMIHGRSRARVIEQLEALIKTEGLEHISHSVLFSYRQFKQNGGRYARCVG
jgi:DNA-binding Lrp family transcriptional regulator